LGARRIEDNRKRVPCDHRVQLRLFGPTGHENLAQVSPWETHPIAPCLRGTRILGRAVDVGVPDWKGTERSIIWNMVGELRRRTNLADFQPSYRGTGGTPMILFARPQRHARRQAQGIIGVWPGVWPVFPIPTDWNDDDDKDDGRLSLC
jgi:hypothetical protein